MLLQYSYYSSTVVRVPFLQLLLLLPLVVLLLLLSLMLLPYAYYTTTVVSAPLPAITTIALTRITIITTIKDTSVLLLQ